MSKRTTPQQRRVFYASHLRGETYAEIAERFAFSPACVRYWCRRQRDGGACHTTYLRKPAGLFGRFDPKVRYRTVTDYAIVGHEDLDVTPLQQALDQAVYELTFELPSRAEGCQGRPPIVAHPELLQPRRPFQPEHELALFDLKRVDAYLATFTWERLVGKTGQITLGGRHERYTVGRATRASRFSFASALPTITLSFTRWMSPRRRSDGVQLSTWASPT